MIRFVKISKRDIIFDRKNASDILNKACSRTENMIVSGIFETDERIIAALEPSSLKKTYLIVPLNDRTEDGIIGEINYRYASGFSFVFSFRINDDMWTVFSF